MPDYKKRARSLIKRKNSATIQVLDDGINQQAQQTPNPTPCALLSFLEEDKGTPVGKESPCIGRQLGHEGPTIQMGPESMTAGRHSSGNGLL